MVAEQKSNDQYNDKEAKARFEAALKGAMNAPQGKAEGEEGQEKMNSVDFA